MKRFYRSFLQVAIYGLITVATYAQTNSFCGTDTVILSLENYQVGSIQWQESNDGKIWRSIQNQNNSIYKFYTSEEKYYRAQIVTSSCDEIYSSVAYVMQKARADAGSDITISGNKVRLSANSQSGATGKWKIISGTGGSLSDINVSDPVFEGIINSEYILEWSLSNTCGFTSDTIHISLIRNEYRSNYVVVDTTDLILSDAPQLAEGIYRIKFSEPLAGINDSVMLIGMSGEGFLRKAYSSEYQGDNTYLFHTDQGLIDDLCINGVFNLGDYTDGLSEGKSIISYLERYPTRKELTTDPYWKEGVFIYERSSAAGSENFKAIESKGDASGGINLLFENSEISWMLENTGFYTFSGMIVLDGSYLFIPNYQFDMLVANSQLEYLKINLDNAFIEKNLQTSFYQASSGFVPEDDRLLLQKSLYKNRLVKLLVIAGVPVVVSTETELLLDASFHGEGVSEMRISDESENIFSAGMKNENGITSTSEESDFTGDYTVSASVNGGVNVQFSLVPTINSKLYGVPGPFIILNEKTEGLLCGIQSEGDTKLWDAEVESSLQAEMGSKVILSRKITQTLSTTLPVGKSLKIRTPWIIQMLAGNNQSAPAGITLPYPLRVIVSDNQGHPVENVHVSFEVMVGNGRMVNSIVLTDSRGIAETYFTVGTETIANEIRVSVADCESLNIEGSPIIFTEYTSPSPDECLNSSLAVGFLVNANSTVEASGVMGISPYTYSIDGVEFSDIAPQVDIFQASGILFYVKDSHGCITSDTWVPEDPCMISTLNQSVSVSGSEVTIAASGGKPPYLFSLDSPADYTPVSRYLNLTEGSHTAYVKDSQECTRSLNFLIGSDPDPGILPVIITAEAEEVTRYTAKLKATITTSFPGNITQAGFCWSLSPNPSVNDNIVAVENLTGFISATLIGLLPETIYYFRAFAVTENGTSYGNQVTFTTAAKIMKFLSFSSVSQVNPAVIDTILCRIELAVNESTDLSSVVISFELTPGATAEISGVSQVSGVTINNFTSPVYYKVKSADGLLQTDWLVKVTYPPFKSQGTGAYSIYANSWGDIDNDRDMDLFASGQSSIYMLINNSGIFESTGQSFYQVEQGDAEFADYDNDGFIDLLYSGTSQPDPTGATKLYRNLGNNTFSDMNLAFPGPGPWANYPDLDWIDIDGDTDLDFVFTTIPENYGIWQFTNIMGSFSQTKFMDCNGSQSIEFCDFDKDLDLDLAVLGSGIYENVDGAFIKMPVSMASAYQQGTLKWTDLNNDGLMDLVYLIWNVGIKALINNDLNSFSQITIYDKTLLSEGTIDVGDIDNDGDNDIIFCGHYGYLCQVLLLRNNNKGQYFTETDLTYLHNPQSGNSKVMFGDYDSDRDLDFLATAGLPDIIINDNRFPANNSPGAPSQLNSTFSEESIVFSWAAAADDHTPSQSLMYNIRVGTSPGSNDIINSMSLPDGKRKVVDNGNVGMNTSYKIRKLPSGTYYWSVQAIDGTYSGGSWASEKSIIIP